MTGFASELRSFLGGSHEASYLSHSFECIWARFPAGTRWVRCAGTAFAQPFAQQFAHAFA